MSGTSSHEGLVRCRMTLRSMTSGHRWLFCFSTHVTDIFVDIKDVTGTSEARIMGLLRL